jgi:hypothetical protein
MLFQVIVGLNRDVVAFRNLDRFGAFRNRADGFPDLASGGLQCAFVTAICCPGIANEFLIDLDIDVDSAVVKMTAC